VEWVPDTERESLWTGKSGIKSWFDRSGNLFTLTLRKQILLRSFVWFQHFFFGKFFKVLNKKKFWRLFVLQNYVTVSPFDEIALFNFSISKQFLFSLLPRR